MVAKYSRMSLKINIFASYASQFYVTAVGILTLPLYLKYMGAETYGLVGFFTMMQAVFQLLDVGLTPTMARETARFNGGTDDVNNLRQLLRTLEGIFVAIAVLGAICIYAGSYFIAYSWLNVKELPLEDVQYSVKLMAIMVALRWISGLYRGTITGFEQLVWLGGFNAAIATARFILVIPFFIYVGTSPKYFFTYQCLVAACEAAILIVKTYKILPNSNTNQRTPWGLESLRKVLSFSLSMAMLSGIWIMVTQIDKLILSKLLPLADYGYFTLAVLVASAVLMISGPISTAILPRMTRLQAEGDEKKLIKIYRNATQIVAMLAVPACLILSFFPEQVLWMWTGDIQTAAQSAAVLRLYALGNGILIFAAFPYYLQFAKGKLRLHLIGSLLFLILLIPALTWSTWHFGAEGAGYAWLISNAVYFSVWTPYVHMNFVKNLHKKWLIIDLAPIIISNLALVSIAKMASPLISNRYEHLIYFSFIALLAISINITIYKKLKKNE